MFHNKNNKTASRFAAIALDRLKGRYLQQV